VLLGAGITEQHQRFAGVDPGSVRHDRIPQTSSRMPPEAPADARQFRAKLEGPAAGANIRSFVAVRRSHDPPLTPEVRGSECHRPRLVHRRPGCFTPQRSSLSAFSSITCRSGSMM
jgi:hypothetical protein